MGSPTSTVPTNHVNVMKSNALLMAICLCLGADVALAQTTPRIQWDEDPASMVSGYMVTIDGARTDYFLTPVGADLTCGCSIVPPFSGGRHTVRVSAYNFAGEVQSTELIVGPTANAGGPYTGLAGTVLAVDASRSIAPTGTLTTFQWTWGDGTSSTSLLSLASHAYAASGTFTIALTVTDNAGAIATATATATIAAPALNPNGYGYRRSITVDHSKVVNSDLNNFALLFSGTYPSLATVAHGGQVRNPNGYDIIFTSDAAGSATLDHEIESYDPSTGAVAFWIRLPNVSHTSDSVIYLWYGNSSISASQENRAGVWDSHFAAVYHLNEQAASPAVNDSAKNLIGTSNANTDVRAVAGQVGRASNGDGITNYTDSGRAIAMVTSNWTMSAWVKAAPLQLDAAGATIIGNGGYTTAAAGYYFFVDAASGRIRAAVSDGVDRAIGSGKGPDLRDNAWHFVAVVYDRTGAMTTFVDAVATEAIDISRFANAAIGSDSDAFIGKSRWSSYMTGALDEVRVSNIVRSPDWMLTEYNNQLSPSTFYVVGAAISPQ